MDETKNKSEDMAVPEPAPIDITVKDENIQESHHSVPVVVKQEVIQETPQSNFDEEWSLNHVDEVIEMCKAYD
ncbi:hypothetical protein E3N88_40215 [Mikania micrantha]|uniref:Uncharacterized protein n=1 Tax=Mikania micrantha TaxID=192012 RepID=A0A5N6LPA4_9ASTR|nr:hypothetical protein E3N88_40215 [Mikania micrantha]